MEQNLKTKEGKEKYIGYICSKANEVLKEGERLTYKEIAERLGDEVIKNRTSRSNRIKMWNEHCFKLDKVSGTQKYAISKINKSPSNIKDGRDGNSMFIKYTKPLMLNYMMNNPNGELIISKSKLMKELGFVNKYWGLAYEPESNKTLLSQNSNLNATMYDIWDLVDNAGSSFRRVLMNTLYHMKKRWDKDGKPVGMFLIDLNSIYTFVTTEYYMKKDKDEFPDSYKTMSRSTMDYMISNQGFKESDFKPIEIHRNSTKDDLSTIHKIYRQVLTRHKLDEFEQIDSKKLSYEVYSDIDKEILSHFGCEYYYEKLHIKYDISLVKQFYDMKEDYHKMVQEFNEMVALNQSINANKRMLDAYKTVEDNIHLKIVSIGSHEDVKYSIETDGDLSRADKLALTRINPSYMDFNDIMINKYIISGETTIEDIREKNGVKIVNIESFDFTDFSDYDYYEE